jgi:hypothetical protein
MFGNLATNQRCQASSKKKKKRCQAVLYFLLSDLIHMVGDLHMHIVRVLCVNLLRQEVVGLITLFKPEAPSDFLPTMRKVKTLN